MPVLLRDGPWEYPMGAVPVVLAPALLRGTPYVFGFVTSMALRDAALLLLLALVGVRRGSLAGAWLWVSAVPLLGPVALARFDVVPTALAVAGFASGPLLGGALLAAGAAVMRARARGDERMTVGFGVGSHQVDGPWADEMLAVSTLGTVAVVLRLPARRAGPARRRPGARAGARRPRPAPGRRRGAGRGRGLAAAPASRLRRRSTS